VKIGMLGSGVVGQTLGAGLVLHGHEVKMGTRTPSSDKVQGWAAKTGRGASAGTFAEAAAFGDMAILATSWDGTEEAVRFAGAKNLAGKVLIDATNPLDFSQGAPPRLTVPPAGSAGAQVQQWLPGVKVVKAFNSVGNQHMVDPKFPDGAPDMFICGDDSDAKQRVASFLHSIGWANVVDVGNITASAYLEALAMIWIAVFFQTQSGNHAFKLLRK
jgi:predicted dinucleotide-binding enzyme